MSEPAGMGELLISVMQGISRRMDARDDRIMECEAAIDRSVEILSDGSEDATSRALVVLLASRAERFRGIVDR